MKKIVVYILTMLSLAVSGCSRPTSSSKPMLAVSIEPQRKILEQLAGDNFEVMTVLAAGANPETFEPTVSQRMRVGEAKVYFTIGYLPFEGVLAKDLQGQTRVVDTSAGIELVTGTHSHGDHACVETDPHVWTSLRNGRFIASNMLEALVTLDPDNEAQYRNRYVALEHRLDSLDNVAAQILHQADAHAFAVWHPSLSYFARDYGLHQIAVGQESKELSIGTLGEIIEEAKADSVRVFFFQREYDSRQAESLNKEIGSRFVIINPLDYDWDNQLIDIAHELAR